MNSILIGIVKQLENLITLLNICIFGRIDGELLDIVHFVTVHVQKTNEILGDHGLFGGEVFGLIVLTDLETLEVTDQHEEEGQGVETAFVEVEYLFQNQ